MTQAAVSTQAVEHFDLSAERVPQVPVQVFKNPIPVAVLVVPVVAVDPRDGVEKLGVLAVRRGIEPQKGFLALPGGYMGYETWRAAGRRELLEETGVCISPETPIELLGIESVRESTRIILFGQTPPVREEEIAGFTPNDEVPELRILFQPEELAFSTHTDAVKEFFRRTSLQ